MTHLVFLILFLQPTKQEYEDTMVFWTIQKLFDARQEEAVSIPFEIQRMLSSPTKLFGFLITFHSKTDGIWSKGISILIYRGGVRAWFADFQEWMEEAERPPVTIRE